VSRQTYRTELEIISDILRVMMENGIEGEHITNIVRNANLSYSVALDKCQKLIKGGIITISKREKNQVFVVTENGIKFYRELRNFAELVHNIKEGKAISF
jgi:predicted transcriptional regulator